MFSISLEMKKIRSKLVAVLLITISGCSSAAQVDVSNKGMTVLETRAEWRERLKWPQACDDGVRHITKHSAEFIGVDVYTWPIGRRLVSVTCETGAYNQGEMLFLETGEKTAQFKLLVFPQFKLISDAPHELKIMNNRQDHYYKFNHPLLWGNLSVDERNATIRNDDFYRSGGGCGVSSRYSLLSNDPEVISLHIQENCQEENIPISDWKVQPYSEYSKWPTIK